MSETAILINTTAILFNTGAVVLAVILLIVRLKFNPAVALVLGASYLGLTSGLDPKDTVETITSGFGDVLAEVGLLIAFGVLTGAILREVGAIERLVGALLRVFGPKRMPYALSIVLAAALQSIFLDVLLVISAPVARNLAPKIGRLGTPRMATALAIGLEVGNVLMVPGVGTLALAGLLGVSLQKILLFGMLLVVPTVIIAVAVMTLLFRKGWWDPAKDEMPVEKEPAHEPSEAGEEWVRPAVLCERGVADVLGAKNMGSVTTASGTRTTTATWEPTDENRHVRLVLLFAPLLGALLLIAAGAIADIAGLRNAALEFLSQPVIALLVGVIGTGLMGRFAAGRKRTERAIAAGFRESGQILILTGVGGSLAAVMKKSGLGDILGDYFSAKTAVPLLMVWVIAAVLHVALGSVTLAAITAAGILAPVIPLIGLDPVLVALATGAGSLFAVHLTSNTFWLLQSIMGQTTRGTLKTCSVGVSVASVVAILLILPLATLV
jgi:H+/gluconate symporter-like permease